MNKLNPNILDVQSVINQINSSTDTISFYNPGYGIYTINGSAANNSSSQTITCNGTPLASVNYLFNLNFLTTQQSASYSFETQVGAFSTTTVTLFFNNIPFGTSTNPETLSIEVSQNGLTETFTSEGATMNGRLDFSINKSGPTYIYSDFQTSALSLTIPQNSSYNQSTIACFQSSYFPSFQGFIDSYIVAVSPNNNGEYFFSS